MKYVAMIPIKFTNKELKIGDTFTFKNPELLKGLLTEGKVKPFCYWLKSVVDDCQMPCFEIEAKIVNYECPYFREYWNKRLKKNTGELTK